MSTFLLSQLVAPQAVQKVAVSMYATIAETGLFNECAA
jgi:hypothetical protein